MEKISQIVPTNARMSAGDPLKSGATRPGAPSFGRPAGESRGSAAREATTAERAGLAASSLADQRRAGETVIIDQMARDFFLSEPTGPAAPADFVPRGSFIDVRA